MDDTLYGSVSRPVQVGFGIVVGVAGLFCLAVFGGAVWIYLRAAGDRQSAVIAGTLFLFLGIPAVLFSFRLLSGRSRREDGGLLSPAGLRVAGVLFIAFPILSLLQGSWDWVLGLTHLGVSTACFTLARYRRRLRATLQPNANHPE